MTSYCFVTRGVLELFELAPGVAAFVLLAGVFLTLPAFMGCRSRRVSSAFALPLLLETLGATDDLRLAGIADFGVIGLVAACRRSGSGLAEEEWA
jgi:hypothetical protein